MLMIIVAFSGEWVKMSRSMETLCDTGWRNGGSGAVGMEMTTERDVSRRRVQLGRRVWELGPSV